MCNPEGVLTGMQVGLPELVSVASSDGHGKRRPEEFNTPRPQDAPTSSEITSAKERKFCCAAAEKERQFVLSLEKERELAAAAAALVNERALAQVNLLRYRPYS